MAAVGFVNALPSTSRGKKSNLMTLDMVCEAAYQGDLESLRLLLHTGDEDQIFNGDINMHLTDCNPLHFASLAGEVDCVKLLLDANADPHVRCVVLTGKDPRNGDTARDKAMKLDHNSVAELLQSAEKQHAPGWYVADGIANNKKLYSEPKPQPQLPQQEVKEAPAQKQPDTQKQQNMATKQAPAKATGSPLPVCLMFPGQGSQYVKMLDTTKDLPEVKDMLATAKDILGYDLLALCLEGPEDKLGQTKHCQPALFVGGLAGIAKLRADKQDTVDRAQAMAGLSLGEYTALCAAGVFSFEEGLKLVKLRGEAMQEAAEIGDQAMVSVAGLEKDKLDQLCNEARKHEGDGAVCQVANALFPKGFACAGTQKAVNFLQEKALKEGALQAKLLKTSGAFHTSMMAPAQAKLKEALDDLLPNMKPPKCRVYMNVTGEPLEAGSDPKKIAELLGLQLVSPVQWNPIMQRAIKDGITDFYECGPQKQLKAMMKRINQKTWNNTHSVEV